MRIVMIRYGQIDKPGSTAIYNYSKQLVKMGHQVKIIFSESGDESNIEIPHLNKQYLYNFKTPHLPIIHYFVFIAKVIFYLFNNNFDIVHVYFFRFCSLIPLVLFIYRKRMLVDIRSGNLRANFLTTIANFLTKLESRAFGHLGVIDKLVYKTIFNHSTSVRFSEIPIGYDKELFDNTIAPSLNIFSFDDNPKKTVVIYIGNITPIRNIDILIKGFLRAQSNNPALRLVLIGMPEDRKVKKMANKHEDIINLIGPVSHQDVPRYLKAADIGLSYIPFNRSFDCQPPTKTLEYLAAGLPTIATNTEGNKKYIKHKVNGIICEDNPISLARNLLRLSNNINLRQRLSRRASMSVKDYSWNNLVTGYLIPAYKDIVKGN